MIKEAAIKFALLIVKIVFSISSLRPLQNKTVMLSSFGDNIQYVIDEVNKQTSSEIFVLKEPRCKKEFNNTNDRNIIEFTPRHLLQFFKGIYHLATSRYIFIDNYHVVLAACDFKKTGQCTQLWHANGAVKYFGHRDKTITERPDSAHKRFKDVYSRFQNIVVSSDEMAYIFGEAFEASDKRIVKTGVPRTDFFFNDMKMEAARKYLSSKLPQVKDKEVLLYAPTFRDDQFNVTDVKIDIDLMAQRLGERYHLLLKLHPAVKLTNFEDSEFVTNVSSGFNINKLLTVTDVLITDYSSIPFEYSILNKPMIFYAYDLKEYEASRGIWFDYETFIPGPLALETTDIINIVNDAEYDLTRISAFNQRWNKYADGQSTARLVEYIYKK